MSVDAADSTVAYGRQRQRKIVVGLALVVLIILGAILSLCIGPYPLSAGRMIAVLMGREDGAVAHVLLNIRFPRVAAAIVAGACLGLSGTVMQNLLRNPLASPFTLGVSQGAAFGAAFAIIVLSGGRGMMPAGSGAMVLYYPALVATSAFAGAFLAVAVILLLSSVRRLSTLSLILAGVAISAFFGAATMFLQYFAPEDQVAASLFWTFGDLGKAGWGDIALMTAIFLPVLLFFMYQAWSFNAMDWGEDTAKGLGVAVAPLRFAGMLLSSLIAAVSVAFLGIIGFVGLIAPHVIRLMSGRDHQFLIPYSALFGALLLLAADLLSRTLMSPLVVPVGIVTSFAGAPFLLYLLVKGERVGT